MQVLIILIALGVLMFVAYRGASVILFAPLAALFAVVLTHPSAVLPVFSGVFMERLAGFVKLYFPVFLLGAVFGKLTEISGFAQSIIRAVLRIAGPRQAILSVVIVCALLTYGGVSLFVVAFAVYPFAAGLFRQAAIPKRLLPASIALGAFTFTMDALPGTPQIQNIIPTTFFHTTAWAAPRLGIAGGLFVFLTGLVYLEWQRRRAQNAGETYGENHLAEPVAVVQGSLVHPLVAVLPLLLVAGANLGLTWWIPAHFDKPFDFSQAGMTGLDPFDPSKVAAIWSVEGALLVAISFVLLWCWRLQTNVLRPAMNQAVGGAMLAALNTGSEYGFGAVIAALPGFQMVSKFLAASLHDPLINVAVTTNILAGITGSASGGMSIALATMSATYLQQGARFGIPNEVLHRIAAMASGGMDSLPHNGAIITLLAITGLTHRQSYRDIFALTILKTCSVFIVIFLYYAFHLV